MRPTSRLYDNHGKSIELGSQLASGGEGTIYSLPANAQFVAKIFHKPSKEKADKLRAMASDSSRELLSIAAWPSATLHESRQGPVVGFVMPKVTGHQEIHQLYGPMHRRKTFPKADWAFLIHTAANCAIAFDAIHSKNYVIGDVNQSNILVSKQALVYLIDCDSFQVHASGRILPCEVGVAQYTPPELQEANFRQVVRTLNHDRFGLAVLIFHLLFMGRHPFAGRFLGRGEMPLEQAIKEFRFAYAPWAGRAQVTPPPLAPRIGILSAELSNLFDRAFRPGSEARDARPTPADWRVALTNFQKGLVACPVDAGHKAPRHYGKCPWCEIMGTGGPNFFMGVAIIEAVFVADVATLARLWSKIERTQDLSFSYARPRVPPGTEIESTVLAENLSADQTAIWAVGLAALGGAALLVASFCFMKLALFGLPLVIVFGVWWLILIAKSPLRRLREQKRAEWQAACESLEGLEADWEEVLGRSQQAFHELKLTLEQVKQKFQNLDAGFRTERQQLEQQKEAILLEHFLETKFISDAVANKEIAGIGAGRQVLLESHGIETAADITESSILAVRGFGQGLLTNLLAWKSGIASKFRFDPRKEVPEKELMALTQKYKQKQDLLRAQLERGSLDLHAISTRTTDQLHSLWTRIQQRVIDVERVSADLQALAVRR